MFFKYIISFMIVSLLAGCYTRLKTTRDDYYDKQTTDEYQEESEIAADSESYQDDYDEQGINNYYYFYGDPYSWRFRDFYWDPYFYDYPYGSYFSLSWGYSPYQYWRRSYWDWCYYCPDPYYYGYYYQPYYNWGYWHHDRYVSNTKYGRRDFGKRSSDMSANAGSIIRRPNSSAGDTDSQSSPGLVKRTRSSNQPAVRAPTTGKNSGKKSIDRTKKADKRSKEKVQRNPNSRTKSGDSGKTYVPRRQSSPSPLANRGTIKSAPARSGGDSSGRSAPRSSSGSGNSGSNDKPVRRR